MKWIECPIIQFGGIQSNEGVQKSAPTLVYTGHESNLQRLKDDYIKEFSSGGTFNAYVNGENVRRIGQAMAKDFSESVKNISALSNTLDPNVLLSEFNSKMLKIETLEAEFDSDYNSYSFNTGKEIGQSILDKNYETTIHKVGGIINASLEAREARAAANRQRAMLYEQRKTQMNNIYWKAVDFNRAKQDEYYKLAAFAESKEQEAHYLKFVDNLECFRKSMGENFSVSNINWLSNKCPQPDKVNSSSSNNNLVSKDVRYSKIAESKYELFKQNNNIHFRDAAISFAGAAINEKPTSKYFKQISTYYDGASNVLALSNLLAAQQIEDGELDETGESRISKLEKLVEIEIRDALINNNQDYIISFLNLGLDNVIYVQGQDILIYALNLDNGSAVETILNKRVESLNSQEKDKKIKETIVLGAIYNSHKSISKLIDLGISIDFKLNKKHPLEVAESMLSVDAYKVLINASSERTTYINKFKSSPILILLKAESDPSQAASDLESIRDKVAFATLVDRMIDLMNSRESYVKTISLSPTARLYIDQNDFANKAIKRSFLDELLKPYSISTSHLYFKYDIISFDQCPKLSELGVTEDKVLYFSEIQKGAMHSLVDGPTQTEMIQNLVTGGFVAYTSDKTLRLNENAGYYIGTRSVKLKPNTNLALAAFELHNPLLFHAIDEKFDLNNIKLENNTSLFEYMLKSKSFTGLTGLYKYPMFHQFCEGNSQSLWNTPSDLVTSSLFESKNWNGELLNYWTEQFEYIVKYEKDRKYFYSEDFDFDKKINNTYPIFILLDKELPSVYSNELDAFDLHYIRSIESQEILMNYSFNKSQQNPIDGSTLLHWYVKKAEGPTTNINFDFPTVEFIQSLQIDKTLKNNMGQTARDYFKANKKNYYKFGTTGRITLTKGGYKGSEFYQNVGGTQYTILPLRDYIIQILK
jgi:hypothetical protein